MSLAESSVDPYSDIECDSLERETGIEITGCKVSFSNKSSLLRTYSIGHVYKFSKTKRYEFVEYLIDLARVNEINETFQLYISNLSIQFQTSDENCELISPKFPNVTTVQFPYDRNELIYPCGVVDTTRSVKYCNYQKFVMKNQGYFVLMAVLFLFMVVTIYILSDVIKNRPTNTN
ncbi:hypothetical protein RF11_07945 [Thelohanellus kitauei]|uniref:Uncharacterized protein n=1 Tax=Thelohanellus kitauei TaxID=669202 RepID=A0A0C2N2S6_THEKT|nr:hypothetical protein RF11_07945 [Thelohanellus kitauei]